VILRDDRIARWTLAATVIAVVVGAGAIVIGLRPIILTVLPSLTSFFIAGLLVAIFGPVAKWLRSRGASDALAAIGTVLFALAIGALIIALFAVPVAAGAAGLLAALPGAAQRGAAQLSAAIAGYQGVTGPGKQALESAVSSAGAGATQGARWLAGVAARGALSLFDLGLMTFLGFILMFWFLKDGARIAAGTLAVVPRRIRTDAAVIGSAFSTSFSGYLLATAINTSLIFIGDGIGFAIIRLPNGWFVAAMGAILGIIPYLGSIMSFFIAVLIGLMAGPKIGILTGLIVFVTDQIVYSFIGPVVASKTVILHPIMVIFALTIGAGIAGVLGAVLSIPVAAAIRVVYIYYRDRGASGDAPATSDQPTAEEA
jgi:predicted PurR-regulated permease PerM